jgi:hypothetical protein
MQRFLDSILAHHERLGRNVLLERLQPGLSPENIKGQLSSTGVSSSNELLDFYGWRNGTRVPPGTPLDEVQFFPGFYLLALEDAIDNLAAFR